MKELYASNIPMFAKRLKESLTDREDVDSVIRLISERIESANIFLMSGNFLPEIENALQHSTDVEESTPLDLPFDSVFIEPIDQAIGWVSVFGGNREIKAVDWIFCFELSFNSYLFCYMYTDKNGKSFLDVAAFKDFLNEGSPPNYKNIREKAAGLKGMTRMCLSALNNKNFSCGQTTISQTVGVRDFKKAGKTKPIKRIKNVILVAPTKDRLARLPHSPTTIDWSHRWEVRGHWRKASTIGKNRAGEYCIPNYTWVSAHVRGPEEALLIKKTRILTGEANGSARI